MGILRKQRLAGRRFRFAEQDPAVGTLHEPITKFPRIFPGSLRFVPGVCVLLCPRFTLADNLLFPFFPRLKMVLPERIELSTSPLPRECSTTPPLSSRLAGASVAGDGAGQAGGPHNRRRMPSLLAITDNGSGRAGWEAAACWASYRSLYKCQMPAFELGPLPACLNQSSICAVEST